MEEEVAVQEQVAVQGDFAVQESSNVIAWEVEEAWLDLAVQSEEALCKQASECLGLQDMAVQLECLDHASWKAGWGPGSVPWQ